MSATQRHLAAHVLLNRGWAPGRRGGTGGDHGGDNDDFLVQFFGNLNIMLSTGMS